MSSLTVQRGAGAGAGTLAGSRVMGLIGNNNTSTPNTQFDVSADEVILVDPSTELSVAQFATGVLTNNISTAGPAANGRDQAGAFSSSSWVHFYFIWNGTTLATVSSTVPPPTGPTLPSSYTHWAYIGAVRYSAAPALHPTRFSGSSARNDLAEGSSRVLSAGTAATMTAVDCSGFIPPNSRLGFFNFIISIPAGSTSVGVYLSVRTTGSAEAGQLLVAFGQAAAFYQEARTATQYAVNSSQSLDYLVSIFSGTGGEAFIDVLGYQMPNGGE